MPSVYILLTRTGTLFSRAIHAATGDPYTHSSLALDGDLAHMYSFARRYRRLPLVVGFVRETLDRGIYGANPHAPCALYEIPVSSEAYRCICRRIDNLYARRFHWRYNILGVIANYFGKIHRSRNRRFCSEFVAECLLEAGAIPFCTEAAPFLEPAGVRPAMLADLPGARCVYTGKLTGLLENLKPFTINSFTYSCYTYTAP